MCRSYYCRALACCQLLKTTFQIDRGGMPLASQWLLRSGMLMTFQIDHGGMPLTFQIDRSRMLWLFRLAVAGCRWLIQIHRSGMPLTFQNDRNGMPLTFQIDRSGMPLTTTLDRGGGLLTDRQVTFVKKQKNIENCTSIHCSMSLRMKLIGSFFENL